MKVRNGFVSNSSTSSFLIYGTEVTSKLRTLLEEKQGDEVELYELFESEGLDYYTETEYGDVVGVSFTSLGEDETPRQFKARVNAKLEGVFGKPVKCEIMQGEYPC